MIAEPETTATNRRLTPLRAIRKKCLWCCLDSAKEVRLCAITECTLHPYRLGKRPKRPKRPKGPENGNGLTPVKAIRKKCLDCSAYLPAEVRRCQIRDCVLYEYRMGKNPTLKGKGNALAFERVNRERRGHVNAPPSGHEEPAISVQGGAMVPAETVRS